MSAIGSKEWFVDKAASSDKKALADRMEFLRKDFLEKFSPKNLETMNGAQLLERVFNNTRDSMMYLLMMDPDYRNFGASSEYSYMSIIYKGSDGIWTLFEKNKHIKMSQLEAEEKAVQIRDQIIACINIIANSRLTTVEDYKLLEKKLSNETSLYNFVTILKYFQMVFPNYFPGMYSNFTLSRCIQILGLKYIGKSSNKRIQNMGVISIFIRNCGIHNIVFGSIYADEWGWEKTCETCPAADEKVKFVSCRDSLDASIYETCHASKKKKERKFV
jgi:hypothetical protein